MKRHNDNTLVFSSFASILCKGEKIKKDLIDWIFPLISFASESVANDLP